VREEGKKSCSPNSPDVFRDGECRSGDDGPRRLVRHELQDHETPRHDLAPSALVLALGDPVVPVRLGVVLLGVENGSGDVFRDMVGKVITDDEGDCLTLANVDARYDTVAEHAVLHSLLEADAGPAVVAILGTVNGNIKLELDVLAVKGGGFALRAVRNALLLKDGGGVRFRGIFKGRENLNV
jgi:hypothetical protein